MPWNDLAATYASWTKWPVIIASVSTKFAAMTNSSNGIVGILPVCVLTNLAAARYFIGTRRYNLIRHGVLAPVGPAIGPNAGLAPAPEAAG